MTKIAVIRIRGSIKIKKSVEDTLTMLRLYRKNSCVILPGSKNHLGMLIKVKDYITWGEVNENTFVTLLGKRGKLPGNKPLTETYLKEKINLDYNSFAKQYFEGKKTLKDIPGLRQVFRLKPPIKGFEKGGIKKPYSLGGVLGYRKDKINDLIMRML